MISIGIVDDMGLFREMFANHLLQIEDVSIWGMYSNGDELIQAIKTAKIFPDILFLDIRMPEKDGIEACKWLQENASDIKTIVLSQYDHKNFVISAAKFGASSYLLKNVKFQELKKAIQQVYHEGYYFNQLFKPKTLIEIINSSPEEKLYRGEPLTKREMEVTKLICQENSYKMIATKLGITLSTVDTHKTRAMKKIGAKKVTGLVAHAAIMGWI